VGRLGSDSTFSGQSFAEFPKTLINLVGAPKNREFLFEIWGSHSSDGAGSCLSIRCRVIWYQTVHCHVPEGSSLGEVFGS
jgi:hypothetical protein